MTATMRTRTALEDVLAAWVTAAIPTARVALAWQGAPRPTLPYLTLRVTVITPIGFDDKSPPDLTTGLQTIYGDRVMTVSVQGYGAGALDLVRLMANSVQKETILDLLLASGLSPMQPGIVNDLTQMLETAPEERAHVDIGFGFKDLDTDNVGVIEHVTGSGDVVADGSQNEGVLGSAILGESVLGGEPLLTITFAADLE